VWRTSMAGLWLVLAVTTITAAADNSLDSDGDLQVRKVFAPLRGIAAQEQSSDMYDTDFPEDSAGGSIHGSQPDRESTSDRDWRRDALRPIRFERMEPDFSHDEDPSDHKVAPASLQYDPACWKPLDTLSLFGGLEGSKQPQDFGVNANFGSRWAANWGFPLLAEYGIGGQIGTSINQTDNAVQVFDRVGESAHRTQNFSTIGVFQRTDRWRWGLGYDFLYESYYDQFSLGQWRGRAGYAVSDTNEFGVWFTVTQQHASGSFLTIPVTLTPLAQGSFYWQHQFATGTRTMTWMGFSEGHAQANLALGDLKKTGNQFVFGAEIDVPLNRYVAIYGQANFISPADSGTVDSFLGLAFYPGGHAFPAMRNPFTPLLSLANSTTFATNLRRN
jgi:hypothetical protein